MTPTILREGREGQPNHKKIPRKIYAQNTTILADPPSPALLRSHITQNSTTRLSPFAVLCGRPFLQTDLLLDFRSHYLSQYIISLGLTISINNDHQNQYLPKLDPSFSGNIHPKLTPGDWVYLNALSWDKKSQSHLNLSGPGPVRFSWLFQQ